MKKNKKNNTHNQHKHTMSHSCKALGGCFCIDMFDALSTG